MSPTKKEGIAIVVRISQPVDMWKIKHLLDFINFTQLSM